MNYKRLFCASILISTLSCYAPQHLPADSDHEISDCSDIEDDGLEGDVSFFELEAEIELGTKDRKAIEYQVAGRLIQENIKLALKKNTQLE